VQAADDATASSATVNEMRLLQLTDLPPVDHSRILGSAYRRQRRYRPLPAVPRVLQDDVKVSLSLSGRLSSLHECFITLPTSAGLRPSWA